MSELDPMGGADIGPTNRSQQAGRFMGLTTARGVAAALSGLWIIVAARQLSLEQFGELSVLLALAVVFVNLSDAGVQVEMSDHFARSGVISRPVLLNALRRRLAYGFFGAIALIILFEIATPNRDLVIPVLFGVSVIATVGHQTLLSANRAMGRVSYDAANEVISRAAVLVIGAIVLLADWGLVGVGAVYALTDVGSLVIVGWLLFARHVVPDDPRAASAPNFRLRHTFPLAVGITVWLIYLRVDIYVLTLLRGADDAALYGAANRFLDVALIPATALAHTILAYVSPLSGRRRLREVHRYLLAAAGIAVVVAIVGSVLATPVLKIFGPEYAAARNATIVLLVSAVPGALVATLTWVAAVTNRRWFGVVAALALVGNVGLNLLVIPGYGIVGAAWATVITQALFAIALYVIVRRGDAVPLPGGPKPNGDTEDGRVPC
jgi:O-antigen/teichoic acid export membrane protein